MSTDERRFDETPPEETEAYEAPALIASYSIDELREEAATCLGDFSGPV
jgi:hypothetical protein